MTVSSFPICPMTGKECHTRSGAKEVIHVLGKRNNLRGARTLNVYECPDHDRHPAGAGRFHVGHAPRRPLHRRRSQL